MSHSLTHGRERPNAQLQLRSIAGPTAASNVSQPPSQVVTYGAEAKTRTAQSMTLSTRTRSHRSQQNFVRGTRADREKIHSASLTARVRFLGERASPKYWTIALRKQTSLEVAAVRICSMAVYLLLSVCVLDSASMSANLTVFSAMNLSKPSSFIPVNKTPTDGLPSRPARPNS